MSTDTVRSASTDMNKNVEGYFCSNCGAKLELNDNEPIIYCGSCQKAYISTDFYGLEKYIATATVSEESAWNTVKRWFKGGARDLAESATLSEIKIIYLPFWKTVTETRTVACGYNIHKDKNGNETYEYLKRMYKRNYTWDNIACDGSEYGIATYDTGVDTIPLFEVTDPVSLVPVTISETDAKDACTHDVAETARDDALAGIDNWTFYKVFPKITSFKMIYLPYIIVRYNYHGREYSVVLNGLTGNVDAGTKPGDKGKQATNFSILFGIGSTLLGAGIGMLAVELITVADSYSSWGEYFFSNTRLLFHLILTAVVAVILIFIGRNLHKKSIHILQYGSEITTGNQKTESQTSNEVR